MHYSENPLFWRAFWRPSWISALGPLFIFGNIVNVFWGHIRNLKKLVWFSPGGAKGPPLAPRLYLINLQKSISLVQFCYGNVH